MQAVGTTASSQLITTPTRAYAKSCAHLARAHENLARPRLAMKNLARELAQIIWSLERNRVWLARHLRETPTNHQKEAPEVI